MVMGRGGGGIAARFLARALDDLRRLVQKLTQRGVRIEFVKESLTFTGDDSPMANLILSVVGAFAEFERALIRERQREGIALAKQRGAYCGRKRALTPENICLACRAPGQVSDNRIVPDHLGAVHADIKKPRIL